MHAMLWHLVQASYILRLLEQGASLRVSQDDPWHSDVLQHVSTAAQASVNVPWGAMTRQMHLCC